MTLAATYHREYVGAVPPKPKAKRAPRAPTKRGVWVGIRATPAERLEWQQTAAARGMTLADYVRAKAQAEQGQVAVPALPASRSVDSGSWEVHHVDDLGPDSLRDETTRSLRN